MPLIATRRYGPLRLRRDTALAQAFQVAYLFGEGAHDLAGGSGRITLPGVSTLVRGARASYLTAAGSVAAGTPQFAVRYPLVMAWIGVARDTANNGVFAGFTANGGIGGSNWFVGGGSSTFVSVSARNNFGTTGGGSANVPGGAALGVPLVVVAQSLASNSHRIACNGSVGTVDATDVGALVAWDRVYVGGGTNNTDHALLLAGSGLALSVEQMAWLSAKPENVLSLFERGRIFSPFSGSAPVPTLSAATAIDITATSARPRVTITF